MKTENTDKYAPPYNEGPKEEESTGLNKQAVTPSQEGSQNQNARPATEMAENEMEK